MASSFKIALTYLLISILWILFSDSALVTLMGRTHTRLTEMQSIKGILFVLATTFMLFLLIRQELRLREKVNQDLARSEAQFRYLFEQNPHPMWIYDLETLNFLDVNQTAVKKYGYSRAEFLAMTIADIRPKEDLTRLAANLETRRNAYQYSGVWRHLTKDGRLIAVDITSHLIDYQNRRATLVVAQDVTEREKAREELISTKHLLELIIQSAPAAIYMTDHQGHVTLWNPAAERIYGWLACEVLGKPLPVVPAEHYEAYLSLRRRVQAGEVISNIEVERVRRDGARLTISLSVASVSELDGMDYIAFALDITESKRLEMEREEKRKLQAELDKEIQLRTMRNHFISTLSHDVRNPLTGVVSSADLLMHYGERMSIDERNRRHADILNLATRLVELLDDILEALRTESYTRVFKPQPIDLAKLMTDIVAEMRGALPSSHLIETALPEQALPLNADPRLLRQAMQNLLSNAIKYSPEGGKVKVELRQNNAKAVIRVQDYGIGIPQSDQDNLFQSFYRGQNVGAIRGTGLGLVIVKQAVELHNGRLDLQSEEGKGTTVTIELPFQMQNDV
jgi:PAS domain S-box-containing protein